QAQCQARRAGCVHRTGRRAPDRRAGSGVRRSRAPHRRAALEAPRADRWRRQAVRRPAAERQAAADHDAEGRVEGTRAQGRRRAGMTAKRYAPYRSFQYLKEGADYRAFRLAKELGRVPAHDYPLTREEQARFERIMSTHPIVSLHDHTAIAPEDTGEL